jgi:NAD(P)-dependent dehydrogenase (short-subunit alcohol dehydrogenase family)
MADRAVAVVTGAASGIGAAVSALLARDGLSVAGVDVSWPAGAAFAGSAALTADVADPAAMRSAFQDLDGRRLGVLRHLVCAAGIQQRVPTSDLSPEQWHRMLAVHLDGGMYACQLAAQRMAEGGSIVLISSVAEFFGWPQRTAYAVAKAGLSAMGRSLAVEWAELGIRVNVIAPGYVDTPMITAARARGDLHVEPATLHALGRLAAVDEITRPIRFLLSDDASFVTGETLVVDGGYSIFKSR